MLKKKKKKKRKLDSRYASGFRTPYIDMYLTTYYRLRQTIYIRYIDFVSYLFGDAIAFDINIDIYFVRAALYLIVFCNRPNRYTYRSLYIYLSIHISRQLGKHLCCYQTLDIIETLGALGSIS